MTPEEIEWKKANGSPLTRALPMLLGIVGALLLGGVAVLGVRSVGEKSVEEHARLEAQGRVERCYNARTHSYTAGPCHQGSSMVLGIGLPALAALAGFAIGFVLGGGKVSPAYLKGARELSR